MYVLVFTMVIEREGKAIIKKLRLKEDFQLFWRNYRIFLIILAKEG